MHRMKFKKVNGIWVKLDEEGEERHEPEPVPQHPALVPSLSTIRLDEDQIREIVQHVYDRISSGLPQLIKDAMREVFIEQHTSTPMDLTSSDPLEPSVD